MIRSKRYRGVIKQIKFEMGSVESLATFVPAHLLTEFDGFKDEEDRVKHVYAAFGYAAYTAQLLETALVNMAILEAFAAGEIATQQEAEDLEGVISGKTLGVMLARLREVVEIDSATTVILQDALGARNDLTHGFFFRHAEEMLTEPGTRKIILTLQCIIAAMRYAERIVECITQCLLKVFGFSQTDIDREFEKMKAAALSGKVA
jgi:hypothetical protein